ncbi:hypothetical protein KSS87_023098, partial [Heliosperma pusillum]
MEDSLFIQRVAMQTMGKEAETGVELHHHQAKNSTSQDCTITAKGSQPTPNQTSKSPTPKAPVKKQQQVKQAQPQEGS